MHCIVLLFPSPHKGGRKLYFIAYIYYYSCGICTLGHVKLDNLCLFSPEKILLSMIILKKSES